MNETIVALSTPPGIAGLAVVRLSGSDAIRIADKCFASRSPLSSAASHTIHYGRFVSNGHTIDTVTMSVFIAPHSYTGEDVVEISCHGGSFVYTSIIDALCRCGAVLARPGEFTRRAFVNGKLGLLEVEAVADIIHSSSVPGAETSARQLSGGLSARLSEIRKKLIDVSSLLELELDFADEDVEFADKTKLLDLLDSSEAMARSLSESHRSSEILRSGYYVGIAGFPNSGKSTLFNALLGRERAIVNERPGTTRDYIEESLIMDGMTIHITDTAGIRDTDDTIEIEGIRFVDSIVSMANLVLVVNDAALGAEHSNDLIQKLKSKYNGKKIIFVQNKIDLASGIDTNGSICVSAKSGAGIEELKQFISAQAKEETRIESDLLVNQRHAYLLGSAAETLKTAKEALSAGVENFLISIDIRRAAEIFGEITGENWSEEVLNSIFSGFCIGK